MEYSFLKNQKKGEEKVKKTVVAVVVLAIFLVGGTAQAFPMRNILISEIGVDLPDDFRPGADFNLIGDNQWGGSANQWGTVIGGPSMPMISWEQDGFSGYNVVAAFAMFETGAWGNLNGRPELTLNGENVGTFGRTGPGSTYARDFYVLDPDLVMQTSLSFSFEDPHTSGTGWSKWYELGIMYHMTVIAVVDDTPPTNPVPEPSTMLLFGTGMMGLIVVRKKRK